MRKSFLHAFHTAIFTLITIALFTTPAYADHTAAHCNELYGGDSVSYNNCISNLPAAGINEIRVDEPTGAISNVSVLISGAVNLIIIIAGLIAFVYLLLGGIKWITSGGDAGQVEAARNQIIQALVGIIVVLAAWALIILIQNITGACFGLGNCVVNLEGLFKE